MHFLVLLLAAAGVLAVLAGAGRAVLRLAHGGAEAWLAGDVVTRRARQGDITGVQDASAAHAVAVRRRRRALAVLTFWLGLLLLPLLTSSPAMVFALYSVLWLVPRHWRARA